MNKANTCKKPAKPRQSKRNKYRRVLFCILALCMLIPLIAGITSLLAVDQSDIDGIGKKLDELEGKKARVKNELLSIENDMDSVLEQKVLLDKKINLCNEEIELLARSIEILDEQITENNKKLSDLDLKKQERHELFKERIRVMYEQGGSSYLAVILKADSMADFLNRTKLIGDILKKDKKILSEMEKIVSEIEHTTTRLNADKQKKDGQFAALEASKAELEADYNESIMLMQKLSDKKQVNANLLEKYSQMWAEASAEQDRLILEYKREQASGATQTVRETQAPPVQSETPPPASGNVSCSYIWPTPGFKWITSDYGNRYHPITGKYSFHTGIDIGAYYGTQILCIADGVVITNTYNSVYGNMVKVDHKNGVVSLYAHMNARSKLAVGKTVKKGTVIGYVGSTGLSSGAHLHFTVYCNGSIANPLNYVSPS